MFGFISDIAKGVGMVVGSVVGPIVGLSLDVVAATLGITVAMAKEAVDAGCKTYEEIKDFHNL